MYFMIANALIYLGVIGLWMKEKRANMIGFAVVGVLETLTLIMGIYVYASFDSFALQNTVLDNDEDRPIMSIYYECFIRVGVFIVFSALQYLTYRKMFD